MKVIISIFILALSNFMCAQNPQWVKHIASSAVGSGRCMALDSAGNVYLAGQFNGSVDLDPGATTTFSSSLGGTDIYIVKVNASGNFVWGKTFGGAGNEEVRSISVDPNGDVLVAGSFLGLVDFDPGPGSYTVAAPNVVTDAYVLKLNSTGDFQWVAQLGASGTDKGYSMTTDASGNVYTTGYAGGEFDFDPGPGTYTLLSSNYDFFISKLNANGTFVWGVLLGGAAVDEGNCIKTDATGNVFVTGHFGGTADFDPGPGYQPLTSSGSQDIFIVKLDNNANFQWAKSMGGTTSDVGYSLAVDQYSNVFVSGWFTGTADFDPGPSTYTLTSPLGNFDAFVCKLNSGGSFAWVKSVTGNGNDACNSISIDSVGCVYTTGYFQFAGNFDPGQTGFSMAAVGSNDIYISKMDSIGKFIWAYQIGNSGNDAGFSILHGGNGHLYLTGQFASSVDFKPGNGTTTLTATSITESFVMKFFQCGFGGPTLTPLSGPSQLCAGSTATYSVGLLYDPTTFNWTFPSGSTSTVSANTATVQVGNVSGNLQVLAINACGATPAGFNPAMVYTATPPSPSVIVGNTLTCAGVYALYSVPNNTQTISFNWQLPPGWIAGQSAFNSIYTTAAPGIGTISVNAINPCGSSPTKTLLVNVNSIPSNTVPISGPNPVCAGAIINYSIPAIPNATVYNWTSTAGWTGTSTTSAIQFTSGTTNATITVKGGNSCGNSAVQSKTILVNSTAPLTPGPIAGSINICEGISETYSITPDANTSSYLWGLPPGWNGAGASNTLAVISNSVSGTLSVSASNGCGISPQQTISINVSSAPLTPLVINGNGTVCAGVSNLYSLTPVQNATSYTWILPNGWTGNSTADTILIITNSVSGVIVVSANNACGASPTQSITVNVNNIPAAPLSIIGNTAVCIGSSYSYSVPATQGATSYSWFVPAGWSGISSTNTLNVLSGSSNGNVSVFATNSCGNSAAQSLSVIASPTLAWASGIIGNASICINSNHQYSVAPVAGATQYSWTVPSGWSASGASNVISVTGVTSNGIIYVSAENLCQSLPQQSLSVQVLQAPTVQVVSTNSILCIGSGMSATLSANGGTTYTWTPGGNGSYIVVSPTINTTYSVTGSDINGCKGSAIYTQSVSSCTPIDITVDNDNIISIFPNPFTDSFYISTESDGIIMQIYSVTGILLRENILRSGTNIINCLEYSKGVYLIRIVSGDTTHTKRLIKL